MGSVYPRGRVWWIKVKLATGKWKPMPTPYLSTSQAEKAKARKMMQLVQERIDAGVEFDPALDGPMTLAEYASRWIPRRAALGIADWKNDEARLRLHALPTMGGMLLEDIRARHVYRRITELRAAEKPLSPKTIRNVYAVLCALFRDAEVEGLIEKSPCILARSHLGELTDADPEWRDGAIFERHELGMLISDSRIPWDRRVLYALEGIAALRHGEAAGLCWRHYEPTKKPLGRILVRRSYGKRWTKTKRRRDMPVHPVLASMLAEWKLEGWPSMMGRLPSPEDLIVPTSGDWRTPMGRMRDKNYSFKRVRHDLKILELRHRRGHDLRRTMISLVQDDGAVKDVLKWGTHGRSRSETINEYTSLQWETVCREVAKLRIVRKERASLCALSTQVDGSAASK